MGTLLVCAPFVGAFVLLIALHDRGAKRLAASCQHEWEDFDFLSDKCKHCPALRDISPSPLPGLIRHA